jgi:two-component system, LuxR family, response regulator FixJ
MIQNQGEVAIARHVIIVVDDDPAVCNSLKFSLELEGFSVRTFGSASELLDSSDVAHGRCYVVDQKMPDMAGMELIAKLRAKKVSAPAILITSQPSGILTRLAAQSNISIVEKPLLGNALLERIRDACGRC